MLTAAAIAAAAEAAAMIEPHVIVMTIAVSLVSVEGLKVANTGGLLRFASIPEDFRYGDDRCRRSNDAAPSNSNNHCFWPLVGFCLIGDSEVAAV